MKTILTTIIAVFLIGFGYSAENQSQEKSKVRVYLEHFQSPEMRQLSVRVLAKTTNRYNPMVGIEVELYVSEVSEENLLGKVITEDKGMVKYTLSQKQFDLLKNNETSVFHAIVNENDSLKKGKVEIEITDVKLSAKFVIEDSIKMIHVNVSEKDSVGNLVPVNKVKVAFLVERPLSPLPIGDISSTDESGNVSMEFPDDIPGDRDGHVNVLVRIVDNEDYGIVEYSEIKNWGVPTYIDDKTLRRSLWASGANAPITLLFFINSLIAGVWGMIIYIIYNVFIINKIGKKENSV